VAILDTLTGPGWNIDAYTTFVPNKSPLSIWNAFAKAMDLDPTIASDIGEEFTSAVIWQSASNS
jgi:hypothetical protein